MKEALFSILAERVVGARVLDCYAGTGAIGFEALSRGAAHVTFVELHAGTARQIRATAESFGVSERVTVLCAAAEKATQRAFPRFDIVYADPPYALPPPLLSFNALRMKGAVDAATILVYEHRADGPVFVSPGFVTTREAAYGEVCLQFLEIER